jgi:hypothetical protein
LIVLSLVFSLALTLLGLVVSSRLHRQWGPLLLGGMSTVTLLVALYRLDLIAATVATCTLTGAATWNFLLNRRTAAAARRR